MERISAPRPCTKDLTCCRSSALPSGLPEVVLSVLTSERTLLPSLTCLTSLEALLTTGQPESSAAEERARSTRHAVSRSVVTVAVPPMCTSEPLHERPTLRTAVREALDSLVAVSCAMPTVSPVSLDLDETETTALSACSPPSHMADMLEQLTDTKPAAPPATSISLPLDAVTLTGPKAATVWTASRPPLEAAIVPATESALSRPPEEAPA
mmetsp:Transcript_66697/g.184680  ORF Transcript_66697/g.184680 Transcript_66697/m.184680 type:complete len:211 (-) Transcript_66697:44-676(-)